MKKLFILFLILTNIAFAAENSFDRLMPIASIVTMATSTCPQGYLSVDGRAVSRTTYSKLFTALGTLYGVGDGSTTFNLPDYRAQFLRGAMPLTTITGSGTVASNNATFTAHNINRTGMKVRLSSGTLSGLSTSTDYYAIVVDSSTLAFATTRANALAGTKIAISGTNTGVIQQAEDPDNQTRLLQNGVTSFAVGSQQEDAFQGHQHFYYDNQSGSGSSGAAGTSSFRQLTTHGALQADGTNGTPRTSSESRSRNIYVLYCIKY